MSVKGCSVLTRSNSSKKFSGRPCPLDITEPPNLQVIQFSYFLRKNLSQLEKFRDFQNNCKENNQYLASNETTITFVKGI